MKAANILFGRNLKRIRTSRGESQDDLAEALETTNVTISRWENGKMGADAKSIGRICAHYKISDTELFKPTSTTPAIELTETQLDALATKIAEKGKTMAKENIGAIGAKKVVHTMPAVNNFVVQDREQMLLEKIRNSKYPRMLELIEAVASANEFRHRFLRLIMLRDVTAFDGLQKRQAQSLQNFAKLFQKSS